MSAVQTSELIGSCSTSSARSLPAQFVFVLVGFAEFCPVAWLNSGVLFRSVGTDVAFTYSQWKSCADLTGFLCRGSRKKGREGDI